MSGTRININNNIIEWAIIRAGHELDEYLIGNPNIKNWLDSSSKPTIKQLEKFTRNVNVPFGYMFLNEPPKEQVDIPFFRSGQSHTDKISLNLYDAVNIVKKRQSWISDFLRDEAYPRLDWVGKFTANDSVKSIEADIRKTLDLSTNWAKPYNRIGEAINYLTDKVEEAGVFINFSGVVGNNNQRKISVDECRGFVVIDDYAPFMFVNSSDAKSAQLFTIIHELAHIWLGVSAGFDNKNLFPADDPIERLCDKVAAEFLVPEHDLIAVWKDGNQDFKQLNRLFKVSPIVIARRALDINLIDKKEYFDFYNQYVTRFNNRKKSSGGNFYATTQKRVSLRFANFVNSAVSQNKLLYKDAYKLTGLKGDTYAKFINTSLK